MLRIKNGKDLRKIESLGFVADPDTYTYWERGNRKIIIYLKDRRIRFNCMDLQSYDVLFDLITNNMVEKVSYYKVPYNERYLELENRIKALEEKLNGK